MDIQGVALLANVSTATVSRVMNNSPNVRPATARHVRGIIKKVSYVPNHSARNLRVRHSKLFGLIVSDVRNPFFAELIDGFEAVATANEIDVILIQTNYDQNRLGDGLRRLWERNVDGIAVITSETNADALLHVKRLKIPFVLLDQYPTDPLLPNVLTDFASGFAEAVRHLRQLGHVDIGFISGPIGLASMRRRRDAFLFGMKSLGLKIQRQWIIDETLQGECRHAAMDKLFAMHSRPTAMIAANDLIAIVALQAALRAGIGVPRDLSIIGFDNLPVGSMVNPPLTTIWVSRQELANHAFSFLLKASGSDNAASPFQQNIRPQLIIRGSTSPPASA